ncbi:MAG TPA: hypothetical protein ENJ44_00925 [Oceanospirillales bacterium]|nr:hypothetical protein [Oceanospirillales bacterium]
MNSNKQKKKQLKAKRKKRAEQNHMNFLNNGGLSRLKVNHANLTHVNTYRILPVYYREVHFTCRDCGSEEIWTAKQQKYYYEVCKGHIDATAVRCNVCRSIIKLAKKEQRVHMQKLSLNKPHPNELFFRDLEKFKKLSCC